jgi:UDP-N-acetyl-D-mannosaminuronic acid transferase (WecB/TagA/CpsF family)
MNNYFGINLEFDSNKIHQLIAKAISSNQKGYVCVVDGNVLTIAQKNQVYCTIVNNSLVNACDGSSIAWLAGKIYKKDFRALTGMQNAFIFFLSMQDETSSVVLETLTFGLLLICHDDNNYGTIINKSCEFKILA